MTFTPKFLGLPTDEETAGGKIVETVAQELIDGLFTVEDVRKVQKWIFDNKILGRDLFRTPRNPFAPAKENVDRHPKAAHQLCDLVCDVEFTLDAYDYCLSKAIEQYEEWRQQGQEVIDGK